MRSNDVLDGRLELSATRATLPTKPQAKCNEKYCVRERKCSDCRTMDSRLFADTRRSCFFIQIDFSALRAMKSCLVRSRLAVCLICAALCSCASVSLKKADVLTARAPAKTPAKIFVKPPEFYDVAVRVDRSGARLEAFKHEMQERFTRRLVRRLSRHVAPAEAVAATAPLPSGNFWLIVSRFDRIDQGSRMLRSVVGFGAGRNKARDECSGL